MFRFYGSLSGQAKTTATRRGGVASGVSAHVRGWNVGVNVMVGECSICGGDAFLIWRTTGSNNSGPSELIKKLCENHCPENEILL